MDAGTPTGPNSDQLNKHDVVYKATSWASLGSPVYAALQTRKYQIYLGFLLASQVSSGLV